MKIKKLRIKIESFLKLKKNWDGYGAEEITPISIAVACSVLDKLSTTTDINLVSVFPLVNGGIQLEVGDLKEIEIFNYEVTEIEFDSKYNIIKQLKSIWKETI